MGKPAARIGDTHICPKVTPGMPPVPHMGGPIVGAGCVTVLIEGLPAATTGDGCICVGEPDRIITGSAGVLIGGKPAARMGDLCMHGGKVSSGAGTVEIGGRVTRLFFKEGEEDGGDCKARSDDYKIELINQAIKDSVILLEKKLILLQMDDKPTWDSFKKWFGQDDKYVRVIILRRIKNALKVAQEMTVMNFEFDRDEQRFKKLYGYVHSKDKNHKITLCKKFWDTNRNSTDRAGVIIHELSHFRDVGKTQDEAYGISNCLDLAQAHPEQAITNADSFEFFIKE